jgi:hypothetical protein
LLALLPDGVGAGNMRRQQPMRTLARVKLKWDVVGIQAVGPQRDQGTQRVIPDDRVEILRILDEEMGRDVHRIGSNGE